MKVIRIDASRLRNDEHFQFQTEFKDLVTQTTPSVLNIQSLFDSYTALYAQEDEAYKKINKSVFTEEIQAADQKRDRTFRSFADINKAYLNHFKEASANAAKRIQIVFDTYGNLSQKPLNEETSGIYNLVAELKDNHMDDINTLELEEWLIHLEQFNLDYDTLVKNRYDEAAAKTTLVLREVRTQIDEVYRRITERIEALYIVEEENEIFENFIRRLNVVVEKYNNTVAQRYGRNQNNDNELTL